MIRAALLAALPVGVIRWTTGHNLAVLFIATILASFAVAAFVRLHRASNSIVYDATAIRAHRDVGVFCLFALLLLIWGTVR